MKFPPLCQISLKSVRSSTVTTSSGTDMADKPVMIKRINMKVFLKKHKYKR